MTLKRTFFILGLFYLMTFITVSCNASSSITRHQNINEDDIPRVKIKVFRGPNEERNGELFATWGYWIKQPTK